MIFAIVALALSTGDVYAQTTGPATRPATGPASTQAAAVKMTVAVFDFEADSAAAPAQADLGREIAQALVAALAAQEDLVLVDCAALAAVCQQRQWDPRSITPEQAGQIGKLVPVRILVTGKAFVLDHQLYLTAKLLSTDSQLVEGVIVTADAADTTSAPAADLAKKVVERIRKMQ